MFLVDDEYAEQSEEHRQLSEKQVNDLKKFIKDTVRERGGKIDHVIICEACHREFPGIFTWGELEAACKELNEDWAVKRAAKAEAKGRS